MFNQWMLNAFQCIDKIQMATDYNWYDVSIPSNNSMHLNLKLYPLSDVGRKTLSVFACAVILRNFVIVDWNDEMVK